MRSVAFHTLGCKVNIYETEAMRQLMEEAGYRTVSFEEKADIYIVNTCSVTNMADKKSRQLLHRAKKENPDSVVVAAGCYVQSAAENLKKDHGIDIIIGNNVKKDIVKIIEEYFTDELPPCRVEEENSFYSAEAKACESEERVREYLIDIGKTDEYEEFFVDRLGGHTRAFVKVQDGCNQFCSYCIIPYTRGRVRSRKAEEILREIEALVSEGYREIVLTGIHLSSYGIDFSESFGLGELIFALSKIKGIQRIRLGSLEPRIIREEFLEVLKAVDCFCPHFHLSLQSGCDETLKRMNRRYSTEEFMRGVELIREYYPKAAITTDIIVGFPGETEEEFEKSRAFIKRADFFETHIFPFSLRQGTRAATMPNQINKFEKNKRAAILAELNNIQRENFLKRHIGGEAEILGEEKVKIGGEEYITGHTKEYIRAVFPYIEGALNRVYKGCLSKFPGQEFLLLENPRPLEEG